jgi:hypothetical protein
MSKERFVEILMEEGITQQHAQGIWDCRPSKYRTGSTLTEDGVRETAKFCVADGLYTSD